MQVTKNEKVVKVIQEETYDIKGLTKAEAIALLLLLSKTNGGLTYNLYLGLDESLGMNNLIEERIHFSIATIDLASVREQIEQLAQE